MRRGRPRLKPEDDEALRKLRNQYSASTYTFAKWSRERLAALKQADTECDETGRIAAANDVAIRSTCQHVSYMGSGNPNWRGGSSVRTKPLSFSAWIAGREAMAMEA
jgi:hypothetical protein